MAASPQFEKAYRELLTLLASEFSPDGVKRKGNSLLCDFGSTFGIASFQKDKHNDLSRLSFTLNCGGGSRFLFESVPLGFTEYKKELGICPFQVRAGWTTGEDLWWQFNSEKHTAASLADEVSARIRSEVLPYLKIFESDEAIHRYIASPDCHGLPEGIRKRYVESYEASKEVSKIRGSN